MSIVLLGSTSGSVTLQEPAVSGTTVLTLPAVSGTIITTSTTGQVIDSGALPVGSVLQVVNSTTSTQVSSSNNTYIDTTLTATITPKFATSKILIISSTNGQNSSASNASNWTLFRGTVAGTNLGNVNGMVQHYTAGGSIRTEITLHFLDSPATTSAQTYTLAFNSDNVGNTAFAQNNATVASMTLMEIAG